MKPKFKRRKYYGVGSFELTQPKMRVSDPCYDKKTWCAAEINNCITGKWIAEYIMSHIIWNIDGKKYDDDRVAALFVRHESVQRAVLTGIHYVVEDDESCGFWAKPNWESLSTTIGVDSGQAGFFDAVYYGNNELFESDGKCGFGDRWYSNCCDATLHSDAGIIANCGVNATSGYGDGIYELWGHKNHAGEIDALALFFVTEGEEEL